MSRFGGFSFRVLVYAVGTLARRESVKICPVHVLKMVYVCGCVYAGANAVSADDSCAE